MESELLNSGAEQTELLDQVETSETTVDDVETSSEAETTTSETTDTTETTRTIDPDEDDRAAWQREFESAPPRVQQALIREAERRQALEDELERGRGTQPKQPPPDTKGQDAELRKFLVDNKRVSFEAQMKAINAQAAGNEAEYEKQLEIMAQADLNIGRINEERARRATAQDFNAKARPYELASEIKSIRHFEPFHEAAQEIADVHSVLEHFVGSEKAYALMDRAMRKVAQSVAGKKPKVKVTAPLTDLDKARINKRTRSETPDGGVATTKAKTSLANEDKIARDWISSWRGKRPVRSSEA